MSDSKYINADRNVNQTRLQDTPIVKKVAKVKPEKVTIKEFLQGVFAYSWQLAHVTAFDDPPDAGLEKVDDNDEKKKINQNHRFRWAGSPYVQKGRELLKNDSKKNTFFVVSSFEPNDDGQYKRRKDQFTKAFLIVIDDVGTGKGAKVAPDKLVLEPSYLLETSKDNFQAGYLFDIPMDRRPIFELILDELVASGISADGKDPGMKGATRYVRLPVGVNNKRKYKEPFQVRLHSWNPLLRYSVDEFCEGWGVDLEKLFRKSERKRSRMAIGSHTTATYSDELLNHIQLEDDPILNELFERGLVLDDYGDGKYEITCPHEDEHSTAGGGSAYFRWGTGGYPYGGFHCFHGHCIDRPTHKFWERLIDESDDRLDWNDLNSPLVDFDDLTEMYAKRVDSDEEKDAVEQGNDGTSETEIMRMLGKSDVIDVGNGSDLVVVVTAGDRPTLKPENQNVDMNKEGVAAVTNLDGDDMVDRFVYVKRGSSVIDLEKDARAKALTLPEWINAVAPHVTTIEKKDASGKKKKEDIKSSKLWLNNPDRKTADDFGFKPGAGRFYKEGDHLLANQFCFPDHPDTGGDPKSLQRVLDHILYLCGNNQDDYFDLIQWIAHKTQLPWERSKRTPLLMSESHGSGKSWLGKLLRKVWGNWNCQSVKMGDVMGENGGFNGFLSKSLLIVIDEVRDKSDSQPWAVTDRIRDTLTEEYLLINHKGGQQGTERIYCNFLLMSNHPNDALRLDKEDRRIHAIYNPHRSKQEEYYIALFDLLDDPVEMGAVFRYFSQLDITGYNPSAPAPKNIARDNLISMSFTGAAAIIHELLADPNAPELVTIRNIEQYAEHLYRFGDTVKVNQKELMAALRDANCQHFANRVRFSRQRVRPWGLKNIRKWKEASQEEQRKELISAQEYFNCLPGSDFDDSSNE